MADKCPKCPAAVETRDELKISFACESAAFLFRDMAVPVFMQSDRCRIAELEAEVTRLRKQEQRHADALEQAALIEKLRAGGVLVITPDFDDPSVFRARMSVQFRGRHYYGDTLLGCLRAAVEAMKGAAK